MSATGRLRTVDPDEHCDRDRRTLQALRVGPGRDRPELHGQRGTGDRVPRPQRCRQEHDAAHAAGSDPRGPRHGHLRRPALRPARPSERARRRRAGARQLPPRAHGTKPPACPRRRRRPSAGPGRRGPRRGRADPRGRPAREGVLDGDAPAPGHRRRAARRSGCADPRRADQRARSARHPLGPRPRARAGRSRPGRADLQPPPGRGGPERGRRRRHRRRSACAAPGPSTPCSAAPRRRSSAAPPPPGWARSSPMPGRASGS